MKALIFFCVLVSFPLVLVVAISCADPVNEYNFQNLENGQTYDDAIRILGRKADRLLIVGGSDFARWQGKFAVIEVTFIENEITNLKYFQTKIPGAFQQISNWLHSACAAWRRPEVN